MRSLVILMGAAVAACGGLTAPARAQHPADAEASGDAAGEEGLGLTEIADILKPRSEQPANSSKLQIVILLTALALVPFFLIMMTCFTRVIIVLSLLRQAMATQQLPPGPVLVGLSLFITFAVMAPTWGRMHREALAPYLSNEISHAEALERGVRPVRSFMIRQVESAGNVDDVCLFVEYQAGGPVVHEDLQWKDVDTVSLIPGFVLSEIKTAFIIGFRIYLPFLVIDMVIASILISMGMMMLPPVLISLPFKILMFVLADGWHLVVGTLLGSFA